VIPASRLLVPLVPCSLVPLFPVALVDAGFENGIG
jgi:hypothetical protein